MVKAESLWANPFGNDTKQLCCDHCQGLDFEVFTEANMVYFMCVYCRQVIDPMQVEDFHPKIDNYRGA